MTHDATLRIGLVGRGAIGTYVAERIREMPAVDLVGVLVARPDGAVPRGMPAPVTSLSDLLPRIDLLVDCAGHGALRAHAVPTLAAGKGVLSVSPGAMADADLERALRDAAERGAAKLRFASGAIGALDALVAAREGGLDRVRYIGRKPPAGWRGSPAEAALDLDTLTEPAEHFSGSAREAALHYPKNANVAALVAMAGTGFDATQVSLIADPGITTNRHEISTTGGFGSFSFIVEGRALPGNPSSSMLAAMSVVAAIRRLVSRTDPPPFAP